MESETKGILAAIAVIAVLLVSGVVGLAYGIPKYRVWSQSMRGQAELARAEQNRMIAVAEAEAAKQSEILRAEGVAKANEIVAESLAGQSEYLSYLWLQGLNSDTAKVIYVPTEANMPILEAGRGLAQ